MDSGILSSGEEGTIMKKRKRRKKLVIAALFILIISGLWTWRYVSLNEYWRTEGMIVPKIVYGKGEIVPFEEDILDKYTNLNGYSISVEDFKIMELPDYLNTFEISEDSLDSRYRDKIGVVYFTIYNDNCDDHINLNYLCMHGIDTYIPVDWQLLTLSNPILEGAYGIQIPHHTKCELILPFYIRKDMLYGDWNRLDQCVFYLHITGFPTEKDIQVQ